MTILDMVFMYLFVYPGTALLARSGLGQRPSSFGMRVEAETARPATEPVTQGATS
jgi:hypothetical protein